MKAFLKSITPFEYCLWGAAVVAIVLSFFLCGNTDYLNLAGSLFGATTLIFVAKGNVIGQIGCVIFAAYYGFVSYYQRYYGEMITYLGMSAPIAIAAVISWLKNPYKGKKSEVAVSSPKPLEYLIIFAASLVVTVAFFFVLRALNTANLWWSTASVMASLIAVLLTFRRSPYYALAYACNDIILIVLWSLAAAGNREYISLVVCFSVFLLEDIYAFIIWLRRRKKQKESE